MTRKKTPSILFITLRSDVGGGPKHLVDLLEEMVKNPQFTIYTSSPLDPPHGEKLRSLASRHLPVPARRFSLKVFYKMYQLILSEDIDVIHSHGRGAGLYARLLKVILGKDIKVVHTFHGIHQDPSLIGRIKLLLDKALRGYADAYIAVAPEELKEAQKLRLIAAPAYVVKNGVNLDFLRIQDAPSPADTSYRLGYYARPDFQKGYDLFFSQLEDYFQHYPQSPLQIVIAGATAENVPPPVSLKEKIRFLGVVEHPLTFFQQIDFLVSFSRWEGLPLAVLEAMAYGKLCLLSKVTGHEAFIEENMALGFIPGESEAFNNLLQQIIQNPQLFERIRLQGKTQVEEVFNISRMTRETLAVYNTILATHNAKA